MLDIRPRVNAMTPIEKRLSSILPIGGLTAIAPRIHAMTPKVTAIAALHSTSMTPLVDDMLPLNGEVQGPPGTQECFSRSVRMKYLK